MIRHDRFLKLAASALDFQLSPDEHRALQRHVAGCAICPSQIAQLRGDASAIAALPLLRPGWIVPTTMRTPRSRGMTRASLRVIAFAALALLVAGAVVVVGGEIIRRQAIVAPPSTVVPTETTAISIVSTPPPAQTLGPVARHWRFESIDVTTLPFGISAVASSGSRLVAVGSRTCVPESQPVDCWADVFISDDGGRSWAAALRSSALRVAFGGIDSGPQPGILDVASGPGGFVAIGYDAQFGAATWRSADGQAWSRSAPDATWDLARVRAVAATSTGWVVGGEVFLGSGPRAAIWTSPDGAAWTRAPDGPVFDIGGYLETGEEPGSGGIARVTALGSTTLAVGSSCDENGFACVPVTWTSSGDAWTRSLIGGSFSGKLRAATSFHGRLIAAGYQPGRLPLVLRSSDGAAWTASDVPGASGTLGIRALAATDGYLLGVLEGVQGIDGVDARQTGELILAASIDGETWELLDGAPDLGLTDLRDVGIAAASDGSMVIVGYGQVPTIDGFKSFVVRVTQAPG